MCRLLAAELFLRCQHIQPCHLKHPLQRCHAPRGQRFRNPDAATNPGRVPSRACPEEHWRTATIEVDGYCPACTQQREETRQLLQSSFNREETGDHAGAGDGDENESEDAGLEEQQIAGEVKEYSCGHRRVRMDPAVLQRFSDDPDPDHPDAEDQHERGAAQEQEHAGDDTRAVERCLRWDKLRLRCESCPERCAECRLRASGLCIQTTVRVNPGFIYVELAVKRGSCSYRYFTQREEQRKPANVDLDFLPLLRLRLRLQPRWTEQTSRQNSRPDRQTARLQDDSIYAARPVFFFFFFSLLHFAYPVFSSVESLVMAPPPPATLPLLERLKMLAQTLQFAWFIGHFTLILAVFRYLLSCITFSTYTTVAQGSYRFAFVAAAATYGIVVYKGYVARGRLGGSIPNDIIKLAGDENVQYLGMALVWLCSRQLLFALLPFAIYSFFHVATYTRTYLIPTFQPSPDAGPASPSGRPAAAKSSPLADQIGRFVKTYYDTSMAMVAALELSLLIRLIFTALTFSSGSWLLLVIYFWFFRSRYTQSSFVQAVVAHSTARIDAMLSHQSTPPAVRQGWEVVKNAVRRLYTVTDLKPYLARFQQQQGPGKKPQ